MVKSNIGDVKNAKKELSIVDRDKKTVPCLSSLRDTKYFQSNRKVEKEGGASSTPWFTQLGSILILGM